MKRLCSGLMALVLIVALAVGCAQKEPPSGIFYDVTGIDSRDTAYTVGDVEFPVEAYLYWAAYACSSMEYNLQMYHAYYGLYEEMFDENGKVKWDAELEGMPLIDQVKEQTEGNIRFYAAIESKAKELGVELNEEDRAELADSFADTMEQMGGEEAFQENLELMGISRETFDRITEDGMLFQKMLDMVTEEGSALYVAPEEYEQDASYTDHILLGTTNQETGESLSDEEIARKRATAEDLLNQLRNAGDDVETLFDQLAAEYGEDPGRAAGKGYMVTADSSFVPEFLDAALSLEPGQVSEIVESTYGYHILYRRHMADVLKEQPEQVSALAEERLYDLLAEVADGFDIKVSEEASALDLKEFYISYDAKVEEISAAKAAENDTGDGAGTGDGTDTAGTDSDTASDTTGGDPSDGGDAAAPADGKEG